MSEPLPRKYCRMPRSKLNNLALGGDSHAQKALVIHQRLDSLIGDAQRLAEKVSAALDRQSK